MNTRPLLAAVLFVAGLAPAAVAELDLSVIAEIRLGKAQPPPPPEVIVTETPKTKGPPPWAPAHGARRKHGYYYYPGGNAYYRPADRMWFYLEGRDWRAGVSLPSSLKIDFTRSVSLEMATDRPHEHHQQVASHYPADYFSKVKIKEKDKGKPAKDKDAESPGSKGKKKDKT